MDARKLASLLRGGPGGPLVIDSRSFVEYNRWHVLSSVNICCSKLVKRRLQQGKVTIAELIQPAVRSQVGTWHPPSAPSRAHGTPPCPGSRHPQGPGLSSSAQCLGTLGLDSLPASALEPKPGSSGSECLEPSHTTDHSRAGPTCPREGLADPHPPPSALPEPFGPSGSSLGPHGAVQKKPRVPGAQRGVLSG